MRWRKFASPSNVPEFSLSLCLLKAHERILFFKKKILQEISIEYKFKISTEFKIRLLLLPLAVTAHLLLLQRFIISYMF